MIRCMTAKRLVVGGEISIADSKAVFTRPYMEKSVMATQTMMCLRVYVKLNDDAIDDGKAADACGHNNAFTKHTLLLRDADDTEQKKRRKRGQQKFIIDLTDVPAKHPYSILVGVILHTRESVSINPRTNGRQRL